MFSEVEGSRQEAYAAFHGSRLVGLEDSMINLNYGGRYVGLHLNQEPLCHRLHT
jgi:hypothetical protein